MLASVLVRAARALPDPVVTPDEPNPEPAAPPPRSAPGVPTEADAACPEQWAYISSTALFNAVCCSRRAGKTNGAVRRAALMLSRPGKWVHYVSLIRRNARKQFWRPLIAYLERLGWERDVDFWVNETEMLLVTAWGSNLQAMSCNDLSGVSSIVGDRSDLFIIDECQEPNDDVIEALVDRAATVMLVDTGGMLDMCGVAPEAEPCYFSKALDNDGWAHFRWTMFDHDHPRSREAKWETVKEICRRRGLHLDVEEANDNNGRLRLIVGPKTHPLVQREYFGVRAKDPAKIAYEYQPGRNDYDPAKVVFVGPDWSHAGGLDLGFQDNDAIVVGSWNDTDASRRLYVRWWWQHNHLDIDDLADVVRVVRRVFPHIRWCGDHGGHAAQSIMLTLGNRMHTRILPKPKDVMVSVGLVNDDYRTGRLVLPLEDVVTPLLLLEIERMEWDDIRKQRVKALIEVGVAASLPDESGRVAKSVNPRTRKIEINKRGFHSDLTEGLRYMHHGSRHFRAQAPEELPQDPESVMRRRVTEHIQRSLERQQQRRSAR